MDINKGYQFEEEINNIYNELFEYYQINNIKLERNKFIESRTGKKREFDLYYELPIFDGVQKCVIECKNRSRPIDSNEIGALKFKLDECNNPRCILISKSGFTKESKVLAKVCGIQIYNIDEIELIKETALRRDIINKFDMFFPTDKTVGEPFWIPMELNKDKKLTGNIFPFITPNNKTFIPLFISKYEALKETNHLKKMNDNFVIRGATQETLRYALVMSKMCNLGFKLIIDMEKINIQGKCMFSDRTAEQINEEFYLGNLNLDIDCLK